jgi:hypothetical protein
VNLILIPLFLTVLDVLQNISLKVRELFRCLKRDHIEFRHFSFWLYAVIVYRQGFRLDLSLRLSRDLILRRSASGKRSAESNPSFREALLAGLPDEQVEFLELDIFGPGEGEEGLVDSHDLGQRVQGEVQLGPGLNCGPDL